METRESHGVFTLPLFVVLITLVFSPQVQAAVLYAAPAASGSGNCASWANACTLQKALSLALYGDEIWVKQGVHYPGTQRSDSFWLVNGVALYGGFAGTETQRDQRNWQQRLTILSGDIDQNDSHDGSYINDNTSQIAGNNAYHVVRATGVDNNTVLDGFVITAGKAESSEQYGGGMHNSNRSNPKLRNVLFSGNKASYGGGMYNKQNCRPTLDKVFFTGNGASYGGGMYNADNSSLTLTDVSFSDNLAYDGGGMYNSYSTVRLTNASFSGNRASHDGGGMYNYYSSLTLTNTSFSGNSASYDGGGMYNYYSSLTLTNTSFSGNSASSDGGGMINWYSTVGLTNASFSGNSASYYGGGIYNSSSNLALTDVSFSGNSARRDGGGMANWSGSVTLTRVFFRSNTAGDDGGGISNSSSNATLTNVSFIANKAASGAGMFNYSGSPKLTNVAFSGNSASSFGGGMYNESSKPTLINVSFGANSAGSYSHSMYNYKSNPTLTNVIMWGYIGTGPEIYNDQSNPLISFSNIRGSGGSGSKWNVSFGTDGGGNIDADPLFVDANNGNLRLQPGSPAIDRGKNDAVSLTITTDLDGNPRIVNGTVDMGAYEYQGGPGPYTLDDLGWVTSFYVAYWGRCPDPEGQSYWVGMIRQGMLTAVEVAENFALSDEAKSIYQYFESPETASDEDRAAFIRAVYLHLLNREPDSEGLNYWVDQLKGPSTPGAVIAHIINAATQGTSSDGAVIKNKVVVGEYFADRVRELMLVWNETLRNLAVQALQGVTDNPSTVEAAKRFIDSALASL